MVFFSLLAGRITAETSFTYLWSPSTDLAIFVWECCKYSICTTKQISKNVWTAKQKGRQITLNDSQNGPKMNIVSLEMKPLHA